MYWYLMRMNSTKRGYGRKVFFLKGFMEIGNFEDLMLF